MIKVVALSERGLTSTNASGQAEVIYKPGEWTTAPEWLAEQGYHLLVFSNRVDAVNTFQYALDAGAFSLWEVEVEEEVTPLPPINLLSEIRAGAVHKIPVTHSDAVWPYGTRM